MVMHTVRLRLLRALLVVGFVSLNGHAVQAPAAKRMAPRFESVKFCELLANLDRYAGKEVEFDAAVEVGRHGGDFVSLGPDCSEAVFYGHKWAPALAYNFTLPPTDDAAKSRITAVRSLIDEWLLPSICREISIPVRVKGRIEVLSYRGPNDPRVPMGVPYGKEPPVIVQIEDIEELM
jgi:hypothetical protein